MIGRHGSNGIRRLIQSPPRGRWPSAPYFTPATAALLVACGGSPPPTTEAQVVAAAPAAPLTVAIQPDAIAVIRVDVKAVRTSPYYGTLLELIGDGAIAMGDAEKLADIVGRTDELVVVLVPAAAAGSSAIAPGEPAPSDPPGRRGVTVMTVMRGTFHDGELATLHDRAVARGDAVAGAAASYHDQPIYGALRGNWASVDNRLWLSCSGDIRPLVDRALDLTVEADTQAADRWPPVLGTMAQRIALEDQPMAAVARVDAAYLPREAISPNGVFDLGSMVRNVSVAGAAIAFDQGIVLSAFGETGDGAAATELAATISRQLQTLSGQMILRMLGLSRILEGARVTTVDSTVTLRATATEDETQLLLGRLGGILALALQDQPDLRAPSPEGKGTARTGGP